MKCSCYKFYSNMYSFFHVSLFRYIHLNTIRIEKKKHQSIWICAVAHVKQLYEIAFDIVGLLHASIFLCLNKKLHIICYLYFHFRQNFVVVLHAVNQYPIDIFLKLEVVHGMDHVYGVAFACRHWTVNRLAFYASAKSTVKPIMRSK